MTSLLVPRRNRAESCLAPYLLLALTLACGPGPGEEKAGRGVLVVVIDGLRADHVGALGYDRATTSVLDSLAAEGAIFSQAYTPSPEVVPAHAAILTGCEPMLARRIPLGDPSRGTPVSDWLVPEELPRLPRELLEHGYATAAFTDHPAIAPVCGFGAGFQSFSGFLSERRPDASETGSEAVITKCLNWLSGIDPSQDWFAYLQMDDLDRLWMRHEETRDSFFEPRPELSTVPPVAEDDRVFFAVPRSRWMGATRTIGQLEARYDGEVRQVDMNLARLFEGLKRLGRWTSTTVAVVGAYGAGFGESGVVADGGTLSDCDLHVPALVRPAESLGTKRGIRGEELFSLIDLAPTLLDLQGIPPPAGMRGASHAALFRGEPAARREIAFASGGLQGGFVAIDARWCAEESSPASLEPEAVSPLSRSWYGDGADHRRDVRRFLHDRSANPACGHLRGSAEDAEASGRLLAAGRDYFAWIEKARAWLQDGSAARERIGPGGLEEIRKRGLLGEEARR